MDRPPRRRRVETTVPRIHVGAGVAQQRDEPAMPPERCQMQRGGAIDITGVQQLRALCE
jgi:hypothetical protein